MIEKRAYIDKDWTPSEEQEDTKQASEQDIDKLDNDVTKRLSSSEELIQMLSKTYKNNSK